MSLIPKEHLSMVLKSVKKLLGRKADKSEVESIKQYVDSNQKQADWKQNNSTGKDYVKNRTHYESNEVVFQHTFTDADAGLQKTLSFIFEAGETCIIEIDGIEYESTAYEEWGSGYPVIQFIAHDNISFYMYSASTAASYIQVSKPCTVVITAPIVHKLDEKYIPDTIARVSDVDIVKNNIATVNNRIGNVFYGSCSTPGSTSAKVANVNSNNGLSFSLKAGVMVCICFADTNLGSSMTLNVNSTKAKTVMLLGSSFINSYYWKPHSNITFLYDGNYWNIVSIEPCRASTTYYGITKLSSSVSSIDTSLAATSYAVKQAYDKAAAALPKSGGTMTGALTLKGNPTSNLHAATKQYVDDAVDNAVDNAIAGIDIPEQKQCDWNQNDETAIDFIKNKPFGVESRTLVVPATSDEGGRITDLEFAKLLWEKKEVAKYTLNKLNTQAGDYAYEQFEQKSDVEISIILDNGFLLVSVNIETGLIVANIKGLGFINCTISVPEIKQLDEKFIPDNIRRNFVLHAAVVNPEPLELTSTETFEEVLAAYNAGSNIEMHLFVSDSLPIMHYELSDYNNLEFHFRKINRDSEFTLHIEDIRFRFNNKLMAFSESIKVYDGTEPGFVPAGGSPNSFLRGDGVWAEPPKNSYPGNFYVNISMDSSDDGYVCDTKFADLVSAFESGRLVYVMAFGWIANLSGLSRVDDKIETMSFQYLSAANGITVNTFTIAKDETITYSYFDAQTQV